MNSFWPFKLNVIRTSYIYLPTLTTLHFDKKIGKQIISTLLLLYEILKLIGLKRWFSQEHEQELDILNRSYNKQHRVEFESSLTYSWSCTYILTVGTFNFLLQTFPDVMIRQGSIDDINAQQFLKISNYEDTVRQLDIYYAIGKTI